MKRIITPLLWVILSIALVSCGWPKDVVQEDEVVDTTKPVVEIKTKLAAKTAEEASQLCNTFVLTLQENKAEAEKTWCSIGGE